MPSFANCWQCCSLSSLAVSSQGKRSIVWSLYPLEFSSGDPLSTGIAHVEVGIKPVRETR